VAEIRGWWRSIGLFIAPSAFLGERVVAGGLPADRVVVLPNPVTPPARPVAPPTRPARFVYAGRLVAEKGLDVLLTAADDLPPGSVIDVYGSGRAEASIRRRVAAARLPVRLHGFVPRTVMAEVYAGATAAVLPALWYENCPMSVLEAAACGLPVVASRIGGIPELLSDGRTGLLVPPGEPGALAAAMRSLAADPSYARRLGVAARAYVIRHHAPEEHLGALLRHYDAVMSS
jgi:glycosyltransferase involved in cell wall biosynthesis